MTQKPKPIIESSYCEGREGAGTEGEEDAENEEKIKVPGM